MTYTNTDTHLSQSTVPQILPYDTKLNCLHSVKILYLSRFKLPNKMDKFIKRKQGNNNESESKRSKAAKPCDKHQKLDQNVNTAMII